MNSFPSENHLAFIIIVTYDIGLTNIKILDKNIALAGGTQSLKGNHFYCYFEFLLILALNAESAKNFQVQNVIVHGNKHHSLTRKKGFRVIS